MRLGDTRGRRVVVAFAEKLRSLATLVRKIPHKLLLVILVVK
jgi:hypothetical protein